MRVAFGLFWLLSVALIGCGGATQSDRIPVTPIRGVLQWNGKPLPGALIVFHPANSEQKVKSQATTTPDGSFVATTYETGDGVPPGEYTLTVVDAKDPSASEDPDPGVRKKSVIPPKFGSITSSKLKVTVDKSKPDLGTLDLK